MPVYAADVLPDTTGRNLGSPSQRWNIYAQNADIGGGFTRFGGVIFVLTAPVAGNQNITTGSDLVNVTIPGGSLNAVGKVLRGTMAGTYTTQAGQTPGLNVQANLSGTTFFLVGTPPLLAGQNAQGWRAQWEVTVYVSGSAAMLDPRGMMSYQGIQPGGTVVDSIGLSSYSTFGGLDLTADQQLQVGYFFTSNTSPANVLTINQLIVEIL